MGPEDDNKIFNCLQTPAEKERRGQGGGGLSPYSLHTYVNQVIGGVEWSHKKKYPTTDDFHL